MNNLHHHEYIFRVLFIFSWFATDTHTNTYIYDTRIGRNKKRHEFLWFLRSSKNPDDDVGAVVALLLCGDYYYNYVQNSQATSLNSTTLR